MQSLEDVPTYFSDYLDISLEVGQVVLSIVVLLAILLPTMYLSRGTAGNVTVITVMLILTELVLVGLGWMPFWVLIATVAVMAIAIATIGTDAVIGG